MKIDRQKNQIQSIVLAQKTFNYLRFTIFYWSKYHSQKCSNPNILKILPFLRKKNIGN